jgi:pimeloyl-ACP methyl ester carboxylesterase
MQSNWTDSYVTVGGDKFHYWRTGQGDKPVVVLLHGFSDNGMCWLPVARDLQDKYDLILPDARGHGLSVRVQPGVQTDGAADAAGFIEALGLKKPIVGGHSMGALPQQNSAPGSQNWSAG